MKALISLIITMTLGISLFHCAQQAHLANLVRPALLQEYYLVSYYRTMVSSARTVSAAPSSRTALKSFPHFKPLPQRKNVLVLGSERLFEPEYFKLIAGKNIAIMANQTTKRTVDRLISDSRTNLMAIFAPEHGFDGVTKAGKDVLNSQYNGIPVYGRYGGGDDTRRIPLELLEGIDVLLFEIQDIGTRHYTYISSMYLAMDSAADAGIPFIVLDRPVGVNGVQIEGPLLDAEYQTFIGVGRLPNRYGMTIGELALFFKHESQFMDGPRYPRKTEQDAYYNIKDLELIIIPMENYNRSLYYDEIYKSEEWICPSPNIPNMQAALCYVGTGLLNGNTIREMVKGYNQFDHISFPFIKEYDNMADFLNQAKAHYSFPGVELKIITDKNTGIPNVLFLDVTDRSQFNPTLTVLALMYMQAVLYPEIPFLTSTQAEYMFTISHGNSWFLQTLLDKENLSEFKDIAAQAEGGINEFKLIRKKYLLY
ncbi:MAG: DUF1343 domain-containing protein [Spirochaetales bacterium]|nr:DUF1343 domain-containing protein [Spirochaetales bacterium]